MKLVKWEELPFEMQTDEVGKCYVANKPSKEAVANDIKEKVEK